MAENKLSADYWSTRYQEGNFQWDIGYASPPLMNYLLQQDKQAKILIPGCGRGHEVIALWQKGYKNVHALDFAPEALSFIAQHCPDFPPNQFHQQNIFDHHERYDFVVEQTLFCALDPTLRENYAQHMSTLLLPEGKLVGVFFNRAFEGGPPFGGSQEEYEVLFKKYFEHVRFEPCMNSIPQRAGSELFGTLSC